MKRFELFAASALALVIAMPAAAQVAPPAPTTVPPDAAVPETVAEELDVADTDVVPAVSSPDGAATGSNGGASGVADMTRIRRPPLPRRSRRR